MGHGRTLIARDTIGQANQLATARAGALQVRFIRDGLVATGRTNVRRLGPPEHGPKLTVQHTIRTADNLLRHSFPHSFPFG